MQTLFDEGRGAFDQLLICVVDEQIVAESAECDGVDQIATDGALLVRAGNASRLDAGLYDVHRRGLDVEVRPVCKDFPAEPGPMRGRVAGRQRAAHPAERT